MLRPYRWIDFIGGLGAATGFVVDTLALHRPPDFASVIAQLVWLAAMTILTWLAYWLPDAEITHDRRTTVNFT
jgi:hypothetical protein